MPLKADWDIELRYNKDTSFTTSVKLYYAYPVVSEEIEDEDQEETGDDRWPEDTIYTESITKDYNEDGNGNELVEVIVASILRKSSG